MPEKMRESDVIPALRPPEATRMLTALLDLQAERLNLVERWYRPRCPGATHLDAMVTLHIFVTRGRGARQQHLIDTLAVPRRTIRDCCRRLEEAGVVCRDSHGRYFPTRATAAGANETWPGTLRDIGRLCEAYLALRACQEP